MERRNLETLKQRLGTARSRRQVLGTAAKGTIGGVGAALIGHGLGNLALEGGVTPAARAQNGECPSTVCPAVVDPYIRRNVYTLSDGEVASLRRGVAVMKQRTPADPTSWAFQANLHAVPVLPEEPVWCQHQSWFFFPWHRMYLYWFERILRAASGDPSLTLPYWNYSDDPVQRVLPRAFGDEFDAAGNSNSLFEPRRAPGINDGSLALSELTVQYGPAFDQINFFSVVVPPNPPLPSFGGPKIDGPDSFGPAFGLLELAPHGGVHVTVGGRTGIFDLVFDVEGVIEYRCGLHPQETGRFEVLAGATPLPNNLLIIRIDNPAAPTSFFPEDVQIPPGTTVRWRNESVELPHSVIATDGAFDSGLLEPPGLMFDPRLAARDPIFWLHHSNVDRLWERWLARKEGRGNPLSECGWMNQEFTFYREDGSSVAMTVKDVLNMTNCLGYQYDDPLSVFEPDPVPPVVATPEALAVSEVTTVAETPADQPITLGSEPVSVSLALTADGDAALIDVAAAAATPVPGAVAPQITLTLEGIEDIGAPGVVYAVFVNAPAETAPDPAGDAFVGTISLFGVMDTIDMDHDMPGDAALQSFNITRAVQAARERGDWQAEVVVSFVPAGLVPASGAPTPGIDTAAAAPVVSSQGPWVTIERMTVTATD